MSGRETRQLQPTPIGNAGDPNQCMFALAYADGLASASSSELMPFPRSKSWPTDGWSRRGQENARLSRDVGHKGII
jgi:hypothetical protein